MEHAKGYLKIFFGYTDGAGKTSAMLMAARTAKEKGIDVAVGCIGADTAPQTLRLADGLEILGTSGQGEDAGTAVPSELDLDGAIARRPKLLIVDELAHANRAGCRHSRRYQDVDELLDAGIDVYTTLNVRQIESLNDIVASITGTAVKERVPDRIFDDAAQVEFVDIEPEELIEQLKDRSVSGEEGEGIPSAESLTALREIALRRSADRMNKLFETARVQAGTDYYNDEQILVCLSASPSNPKIIRTAARMAAAFKGSLTAVFVATSRYRIASTEDRIRLRENIHLAQQLGARVETVYGEDVAFQIAEYAKVCGASKIVLGRSNMKRKYLLPRQTFSERLTELAPNMDIYIIPDQSAFLYKKVEPAVSGKRLSAADVLKTAGIFLAATAAGALFSWIGLNDSSIIMAYILGVLLTAIVTEGRLYSIALSLVSVLAFNFLFTMPRFTFQAYAKEYPVTFLIMFITAFVASSLTTQIKKQAVYSTGMAYRTQILLDTSQLLQKQRSEAEILDVTAEQLIKLLHRDVMFYLAEDDGKSLKEPKRYPGKPEDARTAAGAEEKPRQAQEERKAAEWVLHNHKQAGAGTDTFQDAAYLYLPVRGASSVYAVAGIHMKEEEFGTFENSLLLSILGECALAMEKIILTRKEREAAARAKNEKLRANLLRSISHDLRTPLTSISGNAGVLLSSGDKLDESKKKQLYADIYDDSMWLINLVENLLSVTRIEDGTMHLNLQTELLEEVISEAQRHINRKKTEHTIRVVQKDEWILARMDARLIIQVIINLVDNAIKYTPPGSEIVISSEKDGDMAAVEVADNGPGIADEAKDKVFEMFYTVNNGIADSRRSLGLGLALCKSIITAHGGSISVRDNVPHGAVFRFTLPSEEAKLHES
ncbi:MAG TPA: sensor histidine kinase KdpD [Firmicutes bacterium]|nr:sensor histidine kinase KdpD [Bacillota bacterium]